MKTMNKMTVDTEDLIPPDRIDYILESEKENTLEDEDQFPLGDGKKAIFRKKNKSGYFDVFQKGKFLGSVTLSQVLNLRQPEKNTSQYQS